MDDPNYNPRMDLTTKGVAYAFFLVAAAIATAFLVITSFGILDDDNQYAVTVGLIVFYLGTFFCRDSIWIGFPRRAFWSLVFGVVAFLFLVGIGLFFEYFFSI